MPNDNKTYHATSPSDTINAEKEVVSFIDKAQAVNRLDFNDDERVNESEEAPFCEYQERDAIVALPSWCTTPQGSGCQRCVQVCPTGALSLTEEGPLINDEHCTKCGMCAGVCDAFAWTRITLEDLVARAVREEESEGVLCFTCNEHIFPGLAPRSNVIVLPCLAAVPPEFWSALLARNLSVGIFLDRSYCNECHVASNLAPILFDHALNQAQEWTGKSIVYLDTIPERESILSLYANVDEANRRELLATLANEGVDIATGKHRKRNAGTVDNFHENQERLRAQGRISAAQQAKNLPAVFARKTPWPRQNLIVQAAQALPSRAHLLERYQSVTNCAQCDKTHACVNACPTGARTFSKEGYPKVDARKCIACGVCIATCPQGACDFTAITAHEYCERKPHDQNT